ncbi:MAG: Rieske 2Fe-2S domain-containing protein [Myxococcales bacterium]|nr:Rieske 2Fe-2S domain-containing protein [Myxococcales bacterium]
MTESARASASGRNGSNGSGGLAGWQDASRVPYAVFTDPTVYRREQERIFRGPVWSFVALASELPEAGDFKATFVGENPVVVTRDAEGALHAWVNRCAHRGAIVCREPRGNATDFTCVYHQWCYDPAGRLLGVPFRKGNKGKGGYPKDFRVADHGLTPLSVASHKDLIFVSFDPAAKPLADYLGVEMRHWIDRVFPRPTRVLGYARQYIHANWKLYLENVKDPYHASLLHLFHATFGIYRSSMGGGVIQDAETGLHSIIRAFKIEEEELGEYKKGMRTYDETSKLSDPSLLRGKPELEPVLTNHIQILFPSVVVQQIENTLAVRQIVPKGVDAMELTFIFFGFEDDDDAMLAQRLKQANFVGPAGYISMEDGEAIELVQRSVREAPEETSVIDLGGKEHGNEENLITESMVRSFWAGYRDLMCFGAEE